MIVLGIHFDHDAGATLMKDGQIIINVEAERVTGIKHATWIEAAQAAVKTAFAQSGIRPEEVSAIAYSDLGHQSLDRLPAVQAQTHGPDLVYSMGTLASSGIDALLEREAQSFRADIPVFLVCHSISHAAGAVYMAGFSEACGLVFDAYGTCCGTMAYTYKGGRLFRLDEWHDRYLMGAGYHRVGIISKEINGTHYLDVAGKVMGLQAYGQPIADWVRYFREVYFPSSAETGFNDYIQMQQATHFCRELFPGGLAAGSRSVQGEDYRNLVASMQQAFTSIVVDCVERLVQETKLSKVFLSGGCAMNIISNAAVAKSPWVESLFVPPNCGDIGQAMGAAILAMRAVTGTYLHRPEITSRERQNPYVGVRLLDDPFMTELPHGITRREFNPYSSQRLRELARSLIDGQIIGLIMGRSEIGPRALGNRSILAHASFPDMKDIINQKIKHREWWRPFAPVCRMIDAPRYFETVLPSRYMLMNGIVLERWQRELASITHIDGTARVQVLETREDNELLWDLLTEISEQGAIPVLLNTSFNLSGKPLVNTTSEALELLDNSGMHAFVVEELIFEKIGPQEHTGNKPPGVSANANLHSPDLLRRAADPAPSVGR